MQYGSNDIVSIVAFCEKYKVPEMVRKDWGIYTPGSNMNLQQLDALSFQTLKREIEEQNSKLRSKKRRRTEVEETYKYFKRPDLYPPVEGDLETDTLIPDILLTSEGSTHNPIFCGQQDEEEEEEVNIRDILLSGSEEDTYMEPSHFQATLINTSSRNYTKARGTDDSNMNLFTSCNNIHRKLSIQDGQENFSKFIISLSSSSPTPPDLNW
ncbi:hypothetical protein NCAS_0D01490 [Naumovozyma castellii]|uniref:Uncharacterized protein n=1 Tax=Naumovozyma castellii TaxID=27288 RepID=G0VDU1_NAUCA|nr:hypothetical protein NCAS_0D01490 [Naumovozyma castellii CBS 4309]CCC69730.1 hypothetical protein NCAS_0D01490 [Naumovozyma castellii CBS 4309]